MPSELGYAALARLAVRTIPKRQLEEASVEPLPAIAQSSQLLWGQWALGVAWPHCGQRLHNHLSDRLSVPQMKPAIANLECIASIEFSSGSHLLFTALKA